MPFSTSRRVEFRDTDAAGIVHFSAFFPMMETAEHEMLRSLGICVLPAHGDLSDEDPPVSWPRVAASCQYLAAARFEDLLAIDVAVKRIGTTSVEYETTFRREQTTIAIGNITAVCCQILPSGLLKTPIPELIRDQLAKFQIPGN